MSYNAPTLLWLKQDLRLADHPALSWAAGKGIIIPVYIFEAEGPHPMGAASKWWLHQALEDLSLSFSKLGIDLILRRGDPKKILPDLASETKAKNVTWTRCYEPKTYRRDEELARSLKHDGLIVQVHEGYTLFEPGTILTRSGTPFKVYTPFSKACFTQGHISKPLPIPTKPAGISGIASEELKDWHLVPQTAKWPAGLAAAWSATEQGAYDRLQSFTDEGLSSYKKGRDRPDQDYTSRLSPYLHFGQISPRQVWQRVQMMAAQHHTLGGNIECYLQELLWREFSWHLIHHIPSMIDTPINLAFAHFPWRKDTAALTAWQKGMTGYPIVDAGMRQLWQTGWMHNRIRMVVASFLIKDLLIDWREGMAWFWDTLLDADLGNNTASWQWVAGCGADAAPYFRIFNPILQGKKFDPQGDYVRRYIPELRTLDTFYIHEPWKAPPPVLAKANISLGLTYPLPIVDHASARARALDTLKEANQEPLQHAETKDLFD